MVENNSFFTSKWFTHYGRVAEWPNASVLKTEVLKGTGGSNPSSSAVFLSRWFFLEPSGTFQMNEIMGKLEADPGDIDLQSITSSDKRVVLGAIKGIISSIPCIGPILIGSWDNYLNGRIKDFVDELSTKISELEESKIDKKFLASEEFFDLFNKAVRSRVLMRSKWKAKFIVGLITESILKERDRSFSISSKESFLYILDNLTESEINCLCKFKNGYFNDMSRNDVYEKEDKDAAVALDGLFTKGILRNDATWNQNIVESKQGNEFINYIELLSIVDWDDTDVDTLESPHR